MKIFEIAEKASQELSIDAEKIISPLGDVAHENLRSFNKLVETDRIPKDIKILLFGGEDIINILEFTLDLHNHICINQEPWLDDIYDDSVFEENRIKYKISKKAKELTDLESFLKFCKFKKSWDIESNQDLLNCLNIFCEINNWDNQILSKNHPLDGGEIVTVGDVVRANGSTVSFYPAGYGVVIYYKLVGKNQILKIIEDHETWGEPIITKTIIEF